MAFKDTYRLEKVYYENMWTLLRSLKALKENPSSDEITKVNEMLDDAIACNESIIIIYKNLGELYAEVAEKFVDLLTDLKALRDDLEMWKNEINEKIDDVNNYLMGHIRDLDDRVTSLEGRVSDLEDRMTTAENDIDALEGRMDTAEGDIDALEGRMDTAEGDIDALEGRMDTAEGDIDALEGRMDTAEGDIDALEGRMDTAEDDIDGLQDDVSDLEQNKQDKLTAGFGIEIDANNEISVDTNDVQEKLIAGQNITLTPDATDPTKTVIDASGSALTAGQGIKITNDVIENNLLSIGPTVFNTKEILAGSESTTKTEDKYYFVSYKLNTTNLNTIDKTKLLAMCLSVDTMLTLSMARQATKSQKYRIAVNVNVNALYKNGSGGKNNLAPVSLYTEFIARITQGSNTISCVPTAAQSYYTGMNLSTYRNQINLNGNSNYSLTFDGKIVVFMEDLLNSTFDPCEFTGAEIVEALPIEFHYNLS